jgi:single-strand DNA-binding protein
MNSLNRVQLIGNMGAEPEMRRLENGVAVARLRIATSETYKDREGKEQTVTEWHTVVAWRGLAEVIEKYVHKGDRIFIEGRLTTRSWQGDNNETKYATEIKADNMIMLGGRRDGAPGSASRPPMPGEEDLPAGFVGGPSKESMAQEGSADEDLPF